MKRKLAALLLSFSILSALPVFWNANADTPVTYNAEEIYERAEHAIFYLRVLREDDSLKSTGTGVLLTPDGTAATAYHVVSGGDKFEAVLQDGRVVSPLELVAYDEDRDAVVLKLPALEEPYTALPLREPKAKHGEQVFAMGYPLKNTPIITEGIVNSPSAEINGRDRILTSAQIVSGMSGGPLLDRYGRVSGIISGSLRTMDNIHLIVPIDVVRSLLLVPFGL